MGSHVQNDDTIVHKTTTKEKANWSTCRGSQLLKVIAKASPVARVICCEISILDALQHWFSHSVKCFRTNLQHGRYSRRCRRLRLRATRPRPSVIRRSRLRQITRRPRTQRASTRRHFVRHSWLNADLFRPTTAIAIWYLVRWKKQYTPLRRTRRVKNR